MWVSPLPNIFSYSEDCPCLSLRDSFRNANAFKVNSVPLSDLWFIFNFSRRWTHKELAFYVRLYPVYIFLKDFIVSIITSRYLCSLVFILCLVLGCFLISFSFSRLRESSRCPLEWLLPMYIPSISGGGLPCLHIFSSTACLQSVWQRPFLLVWCDTSL